MLAAEQHELEADIVGFVHIKVQEPEASTAVDPLALESESSDEMAVAAASRNDDESSSKKPEFMTHTA